MYPQRTSITLAPSFFRRFESLPIVVVFAGAVHADDEQHARSHGIPVPVSGREAGM